MRAPSQNKTYVSVSSTRCIVLAFLSALAVSGCAELPALLPGEKLPPPRPDSPFVLQSAQLHGAVLQAHPALDAPRLQAYVDEVGQRLASRTPSPRLDWRFTVLDEADVNAFALPGGQVYLTRGLLAFANSEAELAALIAHEVGHVVARHGESRHRSGDGSGGDLKVLAEDWAEGYGRERELEASRLGAEYLARAGYNPQALVDVMAILKLHERYVNEQTRAGGVAPQPYHAAGSLRAGRDARLREAVDEARRHAVPQPRDGRADYLRQIAGLAFGASPDAWQLHGRLLLHGDLGLALEFPPGWPVRHEGERTVATSPRGDAWVELTRGEGSPQAALKAAFGFDAATRHSEGVLSGFPAVFAAGTEAGHPLIAAAVMVDGGLLLVAGGARDAGAYARERAALRTAINSVRALTGDERQAMRPRVLGVVEAGPDASLAGLARQSPLGDTAEVQLRLINGFYPKGEPAPGQLVKIVR